MTDLRALSGNDFRCERLAATTEWRADLLCD